MGFRFIHTGMSNSTLKLLVMIAFLLIPFFALAKEVPQTIHVADKILQLNGTGIRKATFLKVKVYVASLYLEKRSHSAEEIAQSPLARLELNFVRDIGKERIQNAWKEAFDEHSRKYSGMDAEVSRFVSAFYAVKEGDHISFDFLPKQIQVLEVGKAIFKSENPDFRKALWSIFIGTNPIQEDLKEGILGLGGVNI